MKRTLVLKSEFLADLTSDELSAVQGGVPTYDGPVCYFVQSALRCFETLQLDCFQTR